MQILFVIIAALGLGAALGTVLARNLVHAALFLVAFFFTIACQFVLLEAEFLAALQVLVYIGAVAILLMFGIMLTRNIQGDDPKSTPSAWQVPGLIAGLCMFLVLAYGIVSQRGLSGRESWSTTDIRPDITPVPNEPPSPRAVAVNKMAKVAGDELLTRYVVGFEVAGLLLTAALVGAIAVAHRDEEDPAAPGGKRPTAQKTGAPLPTNGQTGGPPVEVAAAGTVG
ncbi:MAG: NADH-quinone oxidoreductase subunit J [Isosphaeraceae bacterium]